MATTTRRERPVRPLVTLGVLVLGLLAALLGGTRWSDATITPGLALDLEGGTEIILHPVAEGGQQATPDAIKQAIDIIRSRVDASDHRVPARRAASSPTTRTLRVTRVRTGRSRRVVVTNGLFSRVRAPDHRRGAVPGARWFSVGSRRPCRR